LKHGSEFFSNLWCCIVWAARWCTTEADIVDSALQTVMEAAALGIKQMAHKFELCNDLRRAAYVWSSFKIFQAMESSGISQQ